MLMAFKDLKFSAWASSACHLRSKTFSCRLPCRNFHLSPEVGQEHSHAVFSCQSPIQSNIRAGKIGAPDPTLTLRQVPGSSRLRTLVRIRQKCPDTTVVPLVSSL